MFFSNKLSGCPEAVLIVAKHKPPCEQLNFVFGSVPGQIESYMGMRVAVNKDEIGGRRPEAEWLVGSNIQG